MPRERLAARAGRVGTPQSPTGRVVPTIPLAPGTRPTVPVTRPTAPVIPPITQTHTAQPTVPVVPPAVRPTVPVVPTGARPTVPVVPPVVTPVVPTGGRPVVPPVVTPVVPPVVRPTVPPVVPTGARPTAPITIPPVVQAKVPTITRPVVPPAVPPVARPAIPPAQPARAPVTGLINMDQSIRGKLAQATFDVYDFVYRRGREELGPPITTADIDDILGETQLIELMEQAGRNPRRMYLIEYLMTEVQPQFIAELATELGFRRLNTTLDMYYNLLWYINVAENPYASRLTEAEKEYISGLTNEQLLALLGPRYQGPQDKAALIFAIISGKSAPRPDITDIPRYPQVMAYPSAAVWYLAEQRYGLIDEENQLMSLYPPYVHVALQPASVIEQIIAAVNEANVDTLIEQYQMVLPITQERMTPAQRIRYFIEEVANYEPILARQPNLPPPPVMAGRNVEQVRTTLAPYTLREIIDTYEPTGVWRTRDDLIRLIQIEGRGGARWGWRHRWCTNDDTLNVLEAEPHGEIDKENPADPTLSYGVPRNYRCYQAAELAMSWREDPDDKIFHFRVPDWTKGAIDKITGQPLVQDFPTESIRQLRELLQTPPPGYNVRDLAEKVEEGLAAATNAARAIRRLQAEYQAMAPDQQYLVRLYLSWLFVYGMWMRFWRGPGHPWPVGWVEGGGGAERCEGGRRDEHVFIQNSVRTAIMESYEQHPNLKQWIEALPLVDYNFRTGEAQMATGGVTRIIDILNRIQLGDFCLAHGSDLILKTSYYLIARLLGFTTEADFNTFIEGMLPALLDIELQVVNYQLHIIQERERKEREEAQRRGQQFVETREVRQRVEALEARRADLLRPTPKQPPFRPTQIERTHHTDPGIGHQIRFADDNNPPRGGVRTAMIMNDDDDDNTPPMPQIRRGQYWRPDQ